MRRFHLLLVTLCLGLCVSFPSTVTAQDANCTTSSFSSFLNSKNLVLGNRRIQAGNCNQLVPTGTTCQLGCSTGSTPWQYVASVLNTRGVLTCRNGVLYGDVPVCRAELTTSPVPQVLRVGDDTSYVVNVTFGSNIDSSLRLYLSCEEGHNGVNSAPRMYFSNDESNMWFGGGGSSQMAWIWYSRTQVPFQKVIRIQAPQYDPRYEVGGYVRCSWYTYEQGDIPLGLWDIVTPTFDIQIEGRRQVELHGPAILGEQETARYEWRALQGNALSASAAAELTFSVTCTGGIVSSLVQTPTPSFQITPVASAELIVCSTRLQGSLSARVVVQPAELTIRVRPTSRPALLPFAFAEHDLVTHQQTRKVNVTLDRRLVSEGLNLVLDMQCEAGFPLNSDQHDTDEFGTYAFHYDAYLNTSVAVIAYQAPADTHVEGMDVSCRFFLRGDDAYRVTASVIPPARFRIHPATEVRVHQFPQASAIPVAPSTTSEQLVTVELMANDIAFPVRDLALHVVCSPTQTDDLHFDMLPTPRSSASVQRQQRSFHTMAVATDASDQVPTVHDQATTRRLRHTKSGTHRSRRAHHGRRDRTGDAIAHDNREQLHGRRLLQMSDTFVTSLAFNTSRRSVSYRFQAGETWTGAYACQHTLIGNDARLVGAPLPPIYFQVAPSTQAQLNLSILPQVALGSPLRITFMLSKPIESGRYLYGMVLCSGFPYIRSQYMSSNTKFPFTWDMRLSNPVAGSRGVCTFAGFSGSAASQYVFAGPQTHEFEIVDVNLPVSVAAGGNIRNGSTPNGEAVTFDVTLPQRPLESAFNLTLRCYSFAVDSQMQEYVLHFTTNALRRTTTFVPFSDATTHCAFHLPTSGKDFEFGRFQRPEPVRFYVGTPGTIQVSARAPIQVVGSRQTVTLTLTGGNVAEQTGSSGALFQLAGRVALLAHCQPSNQIRVMTSDGNNVGPSNPLRFVGNSTTLLLQASADATCTLTYAHDAGDTDGPHFRLPSPIAVRVVPAARIRVGLSDNDTSAPYLRLAANNQATTLSFSLESAPIAGRELRVTAVVCDLVGDISGGVIRVFNATTPTQASLIYPAQTADRMGWVETCRFTLAGSDADRFGAPEFRVRVGPELRLNTTSAVPARALWQSELALTLQPSGASGFTTSIYVSCRSTELTRELTFGSSSSSYVRGRTLPVQLSIYVSFDWDAYAPSATSILTECSFHFDGSDVFVLPRPFPLRIERTPFWSLPLPRQIGVNEKLVLVLTPPPSPSPLPEVISDIRLELYCYGVGVDIRPTYPGNQAPTPYQFASSVGVVSWSRNEPRTAKNLSLTLLTDIDQVLECSWNYYGEHMLYRVNEDDQRVVVGAVQPLQLIGMQPGNNPVQTGVPLAITLIRPTWSYNQYVEWNCAIGTFYGANGDAWNAGVDLPASRSLVQHFYYFPSLTDTVDVCTTDPIWAINYNDNAAVKYSVPDAWITTPFAFTTGAVPTIRMTLDASFVRPGQTARVTLTPERTLPVDAVVEIECAPGLAVSNLQYSHEPQQVYWQSGDVSARTYTLLAETGLTSISTVTCLLWLYDSDWNTAVRAQLDRSSITLTVVPANQPRGVIVLSLPTQTFLYPQQMLSGLALSLSEVVGLGGMTLQCTTTHGFLTPSQFEFTEGATASRSFSLTAPAAIAADGVEARISCTLSGVAAAQFDAPGAVVVQLRARPDTSSTGGAPSRTNNSSSSSSTGDGGGLDPNTFNNGSTRSAHGSWMCTAILAVLSMLLILIA